MILHERPTKNHQGLDKDLSGLKLSVLIYFSILIRLSETKNPSGFRRRPLTLPVLTYFSILIRLSKTKSNINT